MLFAIFMVFCMAPSRINTSPIDCEVVIEKPPLHLQTHRMKANACTLCLFLLFPGFLLFISGCASKGPVTVQDANYPPDKIDARGLFLENCTLCHGKNGRAHTFHGWLVGAQNLTRADWQDETSDAQIVHAITTGPRVMPAFGKKLSRPEIEALARYVRTFKSTH
jgi:hypothetical protein